MKYLPDRKTWSHIFFWGALWILIPLLFSGDLDHAGRFLVHSTLVWLGIIAVVWLNLEVMLPRLYFRQFKGLYFVAGIGLVVLVAGMVNLLDTPWAELFGQELRERKGGGGGGSPKKTMKMFGAAMPYFTAFIGTALYEISRFASRKEREAADFRSEKLDAELKFLKSQFNPHFLFNALNNIYTLTVLKSDKAPEHLLKLSGMLRYVLYDCKADTVPLAKEVGYLRDYIDLHLLKDSRGLNVKVELDESRPELRIAPMLLLPFVENAFKHSRIEDLEHGWISVRLSTKANEVTLEVRNSLPLETFTKDRRGGIGLENVRRQLELLYPARHRLHISQKTDVFEVFLHLQLSENANTNY